MRTSLPSLPSARRAADEFAALLERDRLPASVPPDSELATLVALARALTPAPIAPVPGFRAALRERLVAEATTRPVAVPAPRDGVAAPAGRPVRHAVRHAVATVTALTLVSGVGAAAASTHAVPGDLLYGLKRQVEGVQLALAFGDLAEGRELLDQAGARLAEAERLAAAGDRTPTISALLQEYSAASQAGADELILAYRETGSEEPLRVLDRFVADSAERLQDLLVLLDPSLRSRVRAALDALATLGAQTRALLPFVAAGSTATDGAGTGSGGRASSDGWAVSRVLDRVADGAGSVSGGTDASLTGGTSLASGGPATAGGSTSDSLASAVGAATGGSAGTATGGGSGSLDGGLLTGGSTATADPLDPVTSLVPVPDATVSVPDATVSVPGPLTTSDPLSGSTSTTSGSTTGSTSGSTSPLPALTGAPCVPLPPLTTC